MTSEQSFSWNDEPIRGLSEDSLHRSHVAKQAAQLIDSVRTSDSSVVFGLTGAWGSGKSSMINMIDEHLQAVGDSWVVARFTPWATNDSSQLLGEFFSSLASALPSDRAARARKALGACASIVAPALQFIPVVGDMASKGAEYASERLLDEIPWAKAFESASMRLRELDVSVLIIADDIDRLQTEELVLVLKVVRLLGRFPRVHYLLAYDEQTLLENLRDSGLRVGSVERSRLFMEKIVQYPLVVPQLLPTQIAVELDEGLTNLMQQVGRPLALDEPRLSGLLHTFQSQLTTPRSIERFLAQLQFVFSLHAEGEVDDIDVILLTLVHMQFPRLWSNLPRWKTELTGRRRSADWVKGEPAVVEWSNLLANAEGESRPDAQALLEDVFPTMNKYGRQKSEVSVCNFEYFDRYFVYTVPEGDVADGDIAQALNDVENGEGEGRFVDLLLSSYPGRSDIALAKFRRQYESRNGRNALRTPCIEIVGAVAGALASLHDGQRSLFSRQTQAAYWLADLLKGLPAQTNSDLLQSALARSEEVASVLFAVREAASKVEPVPDFLRVVAAKLASASTFNVLEHIKQRDDADNESSVLTELDFIGHFGEVPSFLDIVRTALAEGQFSNEDYASRFVRLQFLLAQNPVARIGDFATDVWHKLSAGLELVFEMPEGKEASEYDVSWQNRRRHAARTLLESA